MGADLSEVVVLFIVVLLGLEGRDVVVNSSERDRRGQAVGTYWLAADKATRQINRLRVSEDDL